MKRFLAAMILIFAVVAIIPILVLIHIGDVLYRKFK